MNHVAIIEVTLADASVKRVSTRPVKRLVSGQYVFYDPYVLGCDPIRVEMSIPPGRLLNQQIRLRLANPAGEVTNWDTDHTIEAATVEIFLCEVGQAFSTHAFGIFKGSVLDMESTGSDHEVELVVEGNLFPELKELVKNRISQDNFADLPGRFLEQFHENWIFGDNNVTGPPGAILCPLINTTNNDYLVSQFPCKSVDQVYDGDELLTVTTDYTIEEVTPAGGDTRTVIRLTVGYGCAKAQITANVKGITDTGLSSGTLLTEATDMLKEFLLKIGVAAADIDETSRATVNALGRTGAATINTDQKGNDVVEEWAESFQVALAPGLFTGGSQKLIFKAITQATLGPSLPAFSPLEDIVKGTFRDKRIGDIVNRVEFEYDYWPLVSQYQSNPIFNDLNSQTRLGRTHKGEMSQRWIHASVDAAARVDEFQKLQRESNRRLSWKLAMSAAFDASGGPRLQPGDSLDGRQLSAYVLKATQNALTTQPVVINALIFDIIGWTLEVVASLYGLLDEGSSGDPYFRNTSTEDSAVPPALPPNATAREIMDHGNRINQLVAGEALSFAEFTHSGGADSIWHAPAGVEILRVFFGFWENVLSFSAADVDILADTPSAGNWAIQFKAGTLTAFRIDGHVKPDPGLDASLTKMLVFFSRDLSTVTTAPLGTASSGAYYSRTSQGSS